MVRPVDNGLAAHSSIMPEVVSFYRSPFISIVKTGCIYSSKNIVMNMIFYTPSCCTILLCTLSLLPLILTRISAVNLNMRSDLCLFLPVTPDAVHHTFLLVLGAPALCSRHLSVQTPHSCHPPPFWLLSVCSSCSPPVLYSETRGV